MKKYELTKRFTTVDGKKLYKIRALKDFRDVKKGDFGGFIESENNLSHDGDAWVRDWSRVYGNARVCDNALVAKKSKVFGNAIICDNTQILHNSSVSGDAVIRDNGKVWGFSTVSENAVVRDNGDVGPRAQVHGHAIVCEHGNVSIDAEVCGYATVKGEASVYTRLVNGNTTLSRKAHINDIDGYVVIQGIISDDDTVTFFKEKDGTIGVDCDWFSGSFNDFKEEVKTKYGHNKIAKTYISIMYGIEQHYNVKK